MAKYVDVVVADCSHLFDSHALLHALNLQYAWRTGVLLDEAHNLITRARDMYSVALGTHALEQAIHSAPRGIRSAFNRCLNLFDQQAQSLVSVRFDDRIPEALLVALQDFVNRVTQFLADAPIAQDGQFLDFYFSALHFLRLAEAFGDHSVFEVAPERNAGLTPGCTYSIKNLIPGPFLQDRFSSVVSMTLFSATLQPFDYQIDVLGLPSNTRCHRVETPFSPQQLRVVLRSDLSTRFDDRDHSLDAIADCMAQAWQSHPGNYLAFFSSYDYLEKVHERLASRHPNVQTIKQRSAMSASQRRAFIDGFTPNSQRLGLAVLGGAFGEGIDLPGQRLIGVFITTLGMPAISPLNEILKDRMNHRFGRGFDYAYRLPGLQKVIQAAGRVIRTADDRGQIWLLDQRYAHPSNRQRLPSWWPIDIQNHD